MLPNLFKEPIEIIRCNPGYYNQDENSEFFGEWVEGASNSFFINAIVHPAPGDITDILPEGYREKSIYLVYSDIELFGVIENQKKPDIVIYRNQRYFVFKKKFFPMTHLSHCESIIIKDEKDDE